MYLCEYNVYVYANLQLFVFFSDNLKLSAAHQSKQTLVSGRRGEIHCEFEGKAAQVLWKKVGMLHNLPYGRVLSSNSKTLRFRRVHAEDAGTYKCRAYSGNSIVEATVVVAITGILLYALHLFLFWWVSCASEP